MPDPQQQDQDQGPWTQYQPPPATDEEGPWTKYAKAAPPAVQQPAKPQGFTEKILAGQTPTFWDTVKHAVNPMAIPADISAMAGKAAEWVNKKRDESEIANLTNIASGKQQPARAPQLQSQLAPGALAMNEENSKTEPTQRGSAPTAGYDLASRALRFASGATKPSNVALAGAATLAPEIVGPAMIAHGGYNAIKNAPEALKGNPEAAEAALSGGAEAAGGGALTGGALTTKPTVKASLQNTLTGKATQRITDLASNALSRLRTPAAQEALTQAAQPGVRIPKAQESFAIAGPRIQQIRQAQGIEIPAKGPEALKTVLELNRQAKGQILDAIEDRMGPVAELKPAAKSVADGIRNAVDDLTVEQTPGLKESIERRASTYDKEGGNNWTIRQMENRMHTLNNRLANAYTQATPGEARISAETEMDLAEARELRKTIDSSVENLSGAGVKDLKREYGAQRDLEKALARQYAVATRVKGAPLWEGLAYLQAAGDLASGGVWGAAKAAGRIAIGNRLQTLRDPGYLANQAFHGSKAFEAAEPIPPHAGPPPPKALLTAPPTPAGYTPPADTSGSVRGARYTTPKAQIEGEKPIEAEFVPRRVPTPPERAGINRMLPETAGPKTTIPPAVSPEFAREAIGVARQNPSAGVRVSPGSRELPAPAEMPKSGPPPSVSQRFAKEAIGSMENANRVGARGEQGTRFNEQALQSARRPIKGELPAPQGIKEIGVKHGLEYNPDMDKMTPTHYQFQDSVTGGSFSIPKKGFTEAKLVEALDKYRKSINVGDLSPTVSKKIGRTQERMAKEGQ